MCLDVDINLCLQLFLHPFMQSFTHSLNHATLLVGCHLVGMPFSLVNFVRCDVDMYLCACD